MSLEMTIPDWVNDAGEAARVLGTYDFRAAWLALPAIIQEDLGAALLEFVVADIVAEEGPQGPPSFRAERRSSDLMTGLFATVAANLPLLRDDEVVEPPGPKRHDRKPTTVDMVDWLRRKGYGCKRRAEQATTDADRQALVRELWILSAIIALVARRPSSPQGEAQRLVNLIRERAARPTPKYQGFVLSRGQAIAAVQEAIEATRGSLMENNRAR